MSYRAWKSEFDSDPAIVGTTVVIEAHAFRVIGIAQRGFFGERVTNTPPAFWVPLATEPILDAPDSDLQKPGQMWLWLVGRIPPGTDMQALQSKISEETRNWLKSIPNTTSARDKALIPKQHVVLTQVASGISDMVRLYSPGLRLLAVLSSVVLLIACANIANLLLARGIARRDDYALRLALGASRRRILRQIFTENLLLSSIAGVVALAVAMVAVYLTQSLAFPEATALPVSVTPSPTLLLSAFLISLLAGTLFGIAPARVSMSVDPAQVMRGSLHSIRGVSQLPQKILLVVQAALCLILLTVAILATRSLQNLTDQPMGFDPTNRYVFSFRPASSSYSVERWSELYSKMESQFSRLGGVAHVGLVNTLPFSGDETSACVYIKIPGPGHNLHDLIDSPMQCGTAINQANAAYLDAMGTTILQGRNFSPHDTPTAPPVAIVSQSFAQRFFPGQSPLGRHFKWVFTAPTPTWEIVGVFPDIKTRADEAATPTFYLPDTQPILEATDLNTIVLHFNHPPEDADGMLRRTMARVDPSLPITSLQTMNSLIGDSLSEQRLISWLAIAFGILAVTLASVGLYGVTNYITAQRTHEIGIRMALGSSRTGVVQLVLRSVLAPVALGLAIGLPCSLLAGYSIKGLLYQLPWYEPLGITAAAMLLALCAVIAGLIPARRAASIQPMEALRVY